MHEELKNKVALRAGLKHTSPADCKKLAADIFANTKKKISETTLKRFFGFVSIKHKFSRYTIAALTEYTESDCSITITTKINPAEAKLKDDAHVKFDLQDGNLESGNCISKTDIDLMTESQKKELTIEIKLNKNQAQDLLEDIKKRAK